MRTWALALAFLLAGAFFVTPNTAHAEPLFTQPKIEITKINLEIKTKEQLIAETKDKLEQLKMENVRIAEQKENIKTEVESIRDQVASLAQQVKEKEFADWLHNRVYAKYPTAFLSNTYVWGNCTWAVKNWLPWVQNGWGDAKWWNDRASRKQFHVDNAPRVGAIAVSETQSRWGHVAVVIGVTGETVRVAEMNYQGLNITSERNTHASDWSYVVPRHGTYWNEVFGDL